MLEKWFNRNPSASIAGLIAAIEKLLSFGMFGYEKLFAEFNTVCMTFKTSYGGISFACNC